MSKINPKNGDIITVLNWYDSKDRSYIGDAFRVLAIDGQFVVVVGLRKFWKGEIITLDINLVRLGSISEERLNLMIDEDLKKSRQPVNKKG